MISKRDLLARLLARFGILRVLERFAFRPCLLVLNYHRIGSPAETPFDPELFSASRESFRAQVGYLRHHFHLPRLEEVIDLAEQGFPLRRPTALITFDDGYRDNFQSALPVLQELEAPAIFFIATSFIGSGKLPWWDRIAYVLRNSKEIKLTLDLPWPLTVSLRPEDRSRSITEVLLAFKKSGELDEEQFLQHLEERAGVTVDAAALGRELFMSWEEVRAMRKAGMALGAHTHNHRILSGLSEERQREELVQSRRLLERELGESIRALAYPVGKPFAFTPLTKRVAEETGFQIAFSYYGGVNRPGHTDRFDIRRIPVDYPDSMPLFRARKVMYSSFGTSI